MKRYLIKKLLMSVAIFSIVFSSTSAFALTAKEKQRQELQAQQAAAQAAANQKAAEAAQMKQQIAVVQGQINQTQSALDQTGSSISETQSNIDNLSAQIKTAEENLASEKAKLNAIISQWYMDGDRGFLEIVVGSNNLSELMARQKYYNSIKLQINSEMTKISDLKIQLAEQKLQQENKKVELVGLQNQQSAYKQSVVNQKSLKTSMLNMTEAQKSAYLATVAKLQKDIAQISAQIYAERRSISGGTAGSLGYPYKQPPKVYVLDPWNFYMSECTGYVAWYWNVKRGKRWYNTQPGRGSARYWPEIASTLGYSVSGTPQVGAIVSWYGPLYSTDIWGHVAIVEAVNGDGTIDVSEYNWSYEHDGGTRSHINPANWGSYSYIY
ncbi:MAG: N-acetylmuramoyl-L-alanine amidase [Candidatus Berkelbacteria bacterium Athens1014_28]|uniref:N-acetylmuramoyl-L-alanine amidase n=1 Tax=Candidatus Berkelbacteria bacterium Athens1014_28 TaxID=2017145 RepID=A0A554LJR5_9BACT|nr:MAG: N-acetylmuramoyl-L-alanine amidase [Candidatus Berkelbacteria bacterium Athens1014_28]